MNIGRIGVGATLAALCCAPAHAQESGSEGVYGSIRAGSQWLGKVKTVAFAPAGTIDDILDGGEGGMYDGGEGGLALAAISVPAGSDTIAGRFHTKAGIGIQGEAGYDFGMLRVGIEVGYGRNKISRATITSINGAGLSDFDDADAQAICDAIAGGESVSCSNADGNFRITGQSFAKIRQFAVLASAWLDIPTGMPLEPYVGGGIGMVNYRVKAFGEGESSTKFAWQLGGGAAYYLNPNLALTADYRYRQVKGDTLMEDDGYGIAIGKLKTHTLSAGFRLNF